MALGDVFPSLSRKVLLELEPSILGRLWEKREQFPSTTLGDQDTADLVLRIGYRIEPIMLETLEDLVVVLLDLHMSGRRLPEELAARLEQATGHSYSSQCGELIRKPGAFWDFLQGEWERWIHGEDESIKESSRASVAFKDNRIRVYLDNLFLEGFLSLVPAPDGGRPIPEPWCEVGIESQSTLRSPENLEKHQAKLIDEIPDQDASYQDWFQFANRYSQHVAAMFSTDESQNLIDAFWGDLWAVMDGQFQQWIEKRLDSLNNLPPTRPVVVHHIPGFLRRRVLKDRKVLLLVLDGLSLSQWKALKMPLQDQLEEIAITEDQCFTLIPSLTNICRQAIYSGELPVFFGNTIQRTDCDRKRWKAFWDSATSSPVPSRHDNLLGQNGDPGKVVDHLDSGAAAIGITLRMPDELMHGAKMGWRGMIDQLQLWVKHGGLAGVILDAIKRGYEVYLTADHGNLEAIGEGNLSEGVLVDRRGQRIRSYSESNLRDAAKQSLEGRGIPWDTKTLPDSLLPLLHSGRGAFAPKDERLVCHGGASLDELVVPFVEFSKTD